MVFRIQRVSNYGTSTPAVARTFYQGSEILGFFLRPEAEREAAKGVLLELQRHLLRCVEIRDSMSAEVRTAQEEIEKSGFQFQSGSRVVTLPSIVDLQSRAESFLQSAKLAIAETARLVKPFYGIALDHRYHRFLAWASKEFGKDDAFARAVANWEPWVKNIVDMRNAVDHPSDGPGEKLTTQNFNLASTNEHYTLVEPTWGLSNRPQTPIVADMSAVIDGVIELGEEVLAALFMKLKGAFRILLYEIPAEERDPKCPKRLRVGLEPGAYGNT